MNIIQYVCLSRKRHTSMYADVAKPVLKYNIIRFEWFVSPCSFSIFVQYAIETMLQQPSRLTQDFELVRSLTCQLECIVTPTYIGQPPDVANA